MQNQKFGAFRSVIRDNFEALTSLANIRLSLEDKKLSPSAQYLRAHQGVDRMIEGYVAMEGLSEEEASYFREKLDEIKKEGYDAAQGLEFCRKLEYEPHPIERLAGSSVQRKNSEKLFNKVENISKAMRDPTKPEFSQDNIETLHDMIRYLHQKTIDAMFEVKEGEGRKANKSLSGTKFEIVDIDGTYETNPALEEMITSYEGFAAFKPGFETIRIISADNYINAHLNLGCHSGDISALLDNSGSFLDIKYKESGFLGSPARQKYVAKCLEDLDFKVLEKNGILEAKLRDRSEDTVEKSIGKVSRLFASSKDLDLYRLTDTEIDYSVGFFQAGGVNTKRAVGLRRGTDNIIKKDKEHEEALPYLEHSLKYELNRLSPEGREFVLNEVINLWTSHYGEEVNDEVTSLLENPEFVTARPQDFRESYHSGLGSMSGLGINYSLLEDIIKEKKIYEIDPEFINEFTILENDSEYKEKGIKKYIIQKFNENIYLNNPAPEEIIKKEHSPIYTLKKNNPEIEKELKGYSISGKFKENIFINSNNPQPGEKENTLTQEEFKKLLKDYKKKLDDEIPPAAST